MQKLPDDGQTRTLTAMEDGPEGAEGRYDYAGKTYSLEERESEVWRVTDGERYVGDLVAHGGAHTEGGATYVPRLADAPRDEVLPAIDDWQAALEWMIDQSPSAAG